MRPRPVRLACLAAALVALGAAPSLAGSQSSNSSSNCSNGRCARMETFETERGGFRRGWTRVEQWDERRRHGRGERPWRGYDRHYHGGDPHWRDASPRRHRRDRDD